MNRLLAALMRLRGLVLLTVLLATLFAGITLLRAHANTCTEWDHCPITQRYGKNEEHGVDLWTQGLPITALRSDTITFNHFAPYHYEHVSNHCMIPGISSTSLRYAFSSNGRGARESYFP